jgi:hypothetical protein
MDFYNSKGIFSNESDDIDGLQRALGQRFRSVSVEIVGCAALFSGRHRRGHWEVAYRSGSSAPHALPDSWSAE